MVQDRAPSKDGPDKICKICGNVFMADSLYCRKCSAKRASITAQSPEGPQVTIHQPRLTPFIREDLLKREDLEKVRELLVENNALMISPNKVDGAGNFTGAEERTGNVWVRDNIYTAFALYKSDTDGEGAKAASRIVSNVAKFFLNSASRFDDAIAGRPQKEKAKPSVRFDTTAASAEPDSDQVLWDDKQNSALGYFIWLRCRLCCEGKMPMTGNHLRILALMFEYLAVLEFWADEDTGHWQTEEKLQASSIGAVLAAVKEFRRVLQKNKGMMAPIDDEILDNMEHKGHQALDEILPMECVQEGKERDVDSALLFLIYPFDIVSPEMARTIVTNVSEKLMGPIGFRRFTGDTYWCKDFQPGATAKTMSKTGGLSAAAVQEGEEAQWCVFDPILSAIYGKFYTETREYDDLKKQQFHLGRSLAHITGDDCQYGAWLCPESYYLSRNMWVASDACPLVWSSANLDIAISMMDETLSLSTKDVKWEFRKLDLAGDGAITISDLTSVLMKLNSGFAAEDLQPFLEKFVSEGKISVEQFVDDLFRGALAERC